ncbi:unnamed protein product [Lampetra planeri]
MRKRLMVTTRSDLHQRPVAPRTTSRTERRPGEGDAYDALASQLVGGTGVTGGPAAGSDSMRPRHHLRRHHRRHHEDNRLHRREPERPALPPTPSPSSTASAVVTAAGEGAAEATICAR